MVAYCVAYNCEQLQVKGSGIQFHRFPFSRPAVLKKWVQAIRRANWTPNGSSHICSKHFTDDSYQLRLGVKGRYLKEDAVPSIFDYTIYPEKASNPSATKRLIPFEPSVNQEPASNVPINCKNKILQPQESPIHDYKRGNDEVNRVDPILLVECKSEVFEPEESRIHAPETVYNYERNGEHDPLSQHTLEGYGNEMVDPQASVNSVNQKLYYEDDTVYNGQQGPVSKGLLVPCKGEIPEPDITYGDCGDGNDEREILQNPEQICVKQEKDRFDVLGEFVAHELRNLQTEYAQKTLENVIISLLQDGRLGKYNEPPAEGSTSQDGNFQAIT